jgi:hypothetical protein
VRRSVAGLSVLVLALVPGACSTDGDGGGAEIASGGTIGVATLPPVATTVAAAPASTTTVPDANVVPATVAPAPTTPAAPGPTIRSSTTTAPVTTPPTTAASSPPCRLDLIVEQTQTGYDGITPSDLNCAEGWAAWIGRPGDELSDGFFAIARWTGASWELQNLGTAGVCADAGVPDDLWNRLGCFE